VLTSENFVFRQPEQKEDPPPTPREVKVPLATDLQNLGDGMESAIRWINDISTKRPSCHNTEKKNMPVITPGRRLIDNKTEEVQDKPDLTKFKQQLEDVQSVAAWYYGRNTMAYNAWHARWLGQTVDGRKWSSGQR